jgi:hypothetical protein
MKKILISFSVLLLISCNNHHIDTHSIEPIELKSKKVMIEEIISPDFLTLKNNKLIIASSKGDSMLHVYSLPDLEYDFSFGRKGKGPEEIQLFPMFCESMNETLYVWGYNPISVRKYNINESGEFKFKGIIDLPKYDAFNYMHIINDSLFIYYLPDYLKIVKVDLKRKEYLDHIKMKKENHNESYFYKNRGSIAVNDTFLVFSYLFKKQINIYRINDFKLHKKIRWDYKYSDPIVGDFNTPLFYTNIVAGENYFYALCKDNNGISTVLEVYSYEGVFVKAFTFDITPELFSVDEKNKTIYGFAYDKKYEPYFLKYEF